MPDFFELPLYPFGRPIEFSHIEERLVELIFWRLQKQRRSCFYEFSHLDKAMNELTIENCIDAFAAWALSRNWRPAWRLGWFSILRLGSKGFEDSGMLCKIGVLCHSWVVLNCCLDVFGLKLWNGFYFFYFGLLFRCADELQAFFLLNYILFLLAFQKYFTCDTCILFMFL